MRVVSLANGHGRFQALAAGARPPRLVDIRVDMSGNTAATLGENGSSNGDAVKTKRKPHSPALFRRSRDQGVLFVLPAVLVLVAVLVVPIASAIIVGFQAVTAGHARFVGLENYRYIFGQSTFFGALINTTVFTVVSVASALFLGLAAALLVNERVRGRAVFRVALLLPWVISLVVVGLTWKWIYDPLYGLLNYWLEQLHVINQPVAWLATVDFAMPAILLANIWQSFPFMMVVLLAGLQAIPEEEYEAARIDGASAWQRFRSITLPHLRYIAMIGITLDTIWMFRSFDVVQVMTGGGPLGSTELLSTLIYREMFTNLRFGIASAEGTVMFVITVMLSLIYIGIIKDEID